MKNILLKLFTMLILILNINIVSAAINGDVVYGTVEYSKHWQNLYSTQPTKFIINDEQFGISEVWINVINDAENSNMKLVKLAERPVTTTLLDDLGYNFYRIETSNILKSNTKLSKIIFKVNLDWIESNDIDIDNIKLRNYNNLEWEELPTKKITEGNGIIIEYEAELSEFRQYYAITGKKNLFYDRSVETKEEIPSKTELEENKEETLKTGQNGITISFSTLLVIVVVIFIVIFLKVKFETKGKKRNK